MELPFLTTIGNSLRLFPCSIAQDLSATGSDSNRRMGVSYWRVTSNRARWRVFVRKAPERNGGQGAHPRRNTDSLENDHRGELPPPTKENANHPDFSQGKVLRV